MSPNHWLPDAATIGAGVFVLAASAWAVLRRFEVRFVLGSAAIVLSLVAGLRDAVQAQSFWLVGTRVADVLQVFLAELVSPEYVVPICCALGFAHVVKAAGCDRDLLEVLIGPLRRTRFLLVPGTVVVGFLVNIPVVSQTGVAATLGPVALPLLAAAGVSPATGGAAILVGASIGGELVNPGGPEYAAVITAIQSQGKTPPDRGMCVRRTLPLVLTQLVVATLLLWWMTARADRGRTSEQVAVASETLFRPNWFRAVIPVLPLILLFVTAKPLELIPLPAEFLTSAAERKRAAEDPQQRDRLASLRDSRIIGAAMLVGCGAAWLSMLTRRHQHGAGQVAVAFFEGAGMAYRDVISLIVVAKCFAKSVDGIGLVSLLHGVTADKPVLVLLVAVFSTYAFAIVCGSGIAATQGLYPLFVGPAIAAGLDPLALAAVTVVAGAAGRTSSPVAAVALMSGRLSGEEPFTLAKRVFLPVAAGMLAATAVALLWR